MGGATIETGAPQNRIGADGVLTPRVRGLQPRYLDSWSPPDEKLPLSHKKASACFEPFFSFDSRFSNSARAG